MARKRVAILISGRGSNMSALIGASRHPDYPADIVLVVANKADAGGLAVAEAAGIPTAGIVSKAFPDKAAFEAALTAALETAGTEIICLAGFMRLLSPEFVDRWRNRLINIHPSLLPDFPGLDTHARAIAAGKTEHGCTVHFVRAEMDSGPIIAQARVPVSPADTPETLAARVLEAEHRLYPEALALVASGAVRVEGETIVGTTR